jgi:hypothetical protein
MHEEFGDFGAVPLIGRRVHHELHRACDAPVEAGDQKATCTGFDSGKDLVAPEGAGVVEREGKNKADAGAGVYGRMEDVRKLVNVAGDVGGRGTQRDCDAGHLQ